MMTHLEERLAEVSSRQDLARFVELLRDDLRDHRDEWENDTLERYLDALAACIEHLDGYFQNVGMPIPEDVRWKLLGQLLLTAKVYE
jgi:hypothetical protein